MRANFPEVDADELQTPFSPELPSIEPILQSLDTTPPDPTFYDRLRQSRVARTVLGLATATGLFTASTAIEASPASADEALIYAVQDAETGVFARHSPHQNDTDRIVGQGAYGGDQIQLICGTTDGDPVGPYNNRTWHKVKDLTNGQGPFWISDHWTNTPVKASNHELVPGEADCDDGTTGPRSTHETNQEPPAHHTTVIGQCAGPFWGVYQQDICVNAHMGEKNSGNHTQWVGNVDAVVKTEVPSSLEIWGKGFYRKSYGTYYSQPINSWVPSGSGICAAATDKHDVREVTCITVKVP